MPGKGDAVGGPRGADVKCAEDGALCGEDGGGILRAG